MAHMQDRIARSMITLPELFLSWKKRKTGSKKTLILSMLMGTDTFIFGVSGVVFASMI